MIDGTTHRGLQTHANPGIARDPPSKKTTRPPKKSKKPDAIGTTAEIPKNNISTPLHSLSDSKTSGLRAFPDSIKRTPYEVNLAVSASTESKDQNGLQPKSKATPKPKPKPKPKATQQPGSFVAETHTSLVRDTLQIDHHIKNKTQTQTSKLETHMQKPTEKKPEEPTKSKVSSETKTTRKSTLRDMRQQIKAVAPEYAALEASIDWEAVHENWENAKAKPKPNRTWLEEFVLNPKADPEEVGEDIGNSDDEDEGEEDDDDAIRAEMDGFIVDDEEF